ncbi:outer membrane lipoprotein [Neisseria weaveri]|uniref:Outer-membrane lipoprotein LolB n=2 Tax=Neisseria weaveri TaxID=28091 RepID=A0A3S4Z5C6_9NEIS|nr:lipoprotein insertase outer membrane protein LolB [Neisseria weaveri]VEJ51827.1 outer membrane lipoprotein [Neisseria weaveri]
MIMIKHKTLFAKTALSSFVLLLASCVGVPEPQGGYWQEPKDIQAFEAEGRLAVKVEGKGSYANFDWQYNRSVQTININSPLGNTLGQLCRDEQGVLAVDHNGKTYQADSADDLSRQLLGFALPLQYLHVWTHGYWVRDLPYELLPSGRLKQKDWIISRTLTEKGTTKVLSMENPKLGLRLVFDHINSSNGKQVLQQCEARMK